MEDLEKAAEVLEEAMEFEDTKKFPEAIMSFQMAFYFFNQILLNKEFIIASATVLNIEENMQYCIERIKNLNLQTEKNQNKIIDINEERTGILKKLKQL